jgi:hypothetical protein
MCDTYVFRHSLSALMPFTLVPQPISATSALLPCRKAQNVVKPSNWGRRVALDDLVMSSLFCSACETDCKREQEG